MITKKVFNDLAIYMIGFGILVGIIFPFLIIQTGIPRSYIFKPVLFFLCIVAGSIVGLVNLWISKRIVEVKIKNLSKHMKLIENHINNSFQNSDVNKHTEEDYLIKVETEDEIGDSAIAFNSLASTLSIAMESELSIRKFSEMLASHLELTELSNESIASLMLNLNAEGGVIIIERDGELNILSAIGVRNPDAFLTNEFVWEVIKHQKRYLMDSSNNEFLNGLLIDSKSKMLMIEPLINKEAIFGVVILVSTSTFTVEMLKNMKQYSFGLALAFKNALTYEQLQRLAAQDPLTDTLNRRYGMLRFKEEIARSKRTSLPIGLIFLDIDRFKEINDLYGHPVGDKVLIDLAKSLKISLRENDILLRYGGDEFLIILPEATLEEVQIISERLRKRVESNVTNHLGFDVKITISIGGTSSLEQGINMEDKLIEIADTNLYLAKDLGRNRIIAR